jgi:hypothetical protein
MSHPFFFIDQEKKNKRRREAFKEERWKKKIKFGVLHRSVEDPVSGVIRQPWIGRLRRAEKRVELGVSGAVLLERLGCCRHFNPRSYQLTRQEIDLIV